MASPNVSTALPQLEVRDGTTFTVDASASGGVVTQLVVHGWREGEPVAEPVPLEPVLAVDPVPGG